MVPGAPRRGVSYRRRVPVPPVARPGGAQVRHHFDDALALVPVGGGSDGCWLGRTSDAYANMVGPFGGITAAVLVAAVERHPDRLGEVLSVTVSFAGPVADGEFEVVASPVRTNRSSQHWVVEQRQGGQVCTVATVLTGLRRAGWSATELHPPTVPAFEALAPMPQALPLRWLHSFDLRYVSGPVPPATGGREEPDSTSVLWARNAPPRVLDVPALVAYCDVFYPRVFRRLGRWMPAGTVTFSAYVHADAATLAAYGDGEVLAVARGQQYRDGYFDQSAQVWDRDGRLLATSHQLVYFKS